MNAHTLSLAESRKRDFLQHSFGPIIRAALEDPRVVEIMVNDDGRIWIDKAGEGRTNSGERLDPAAAEQVLRMMADHSGTTVTRQRPIFGGVLPETGERFQGLYPPVVTAPSFTIRKRPAVIFTLDDYVAQGIMTGEQRDALRQAVADRLNIIVAGGTGSGKTTLLNALLAEPAFGDDRVILIEDTRELQCSAPDHLFLLSRRGEHPVTMADLVAASLRLRPDRIVGGEVRDGAAALGLLKAWNTGHSGGLSTIHANSAEETLDRLDQLISEVLPNSQARLISQSVNVVAFMERTRSGRRLGQIIRITPNKRPGDFTITAYRGRA
jgi:type IV secretion system protein VirB11